MPLPAISFTPSQQNARSSLIDTSDDSEDGMDGILSMLRSSNPKTPTSSESNNVGNSSTMKQNSSSVSSRRVKFDPAFDKDETPSQLQSDRSRRIKSSQPEHDSTVTFTKSHGNRIASQNREQRATDLKANPNTVGQVRDEGTSSSKDDLKRSTILTQNQLQHPTNTDSYNAMIQKIAESHEGLQEICSGIKALQTAVAASTTQDENTSTTVKCLIQGVSESQQQLGELTANLSSMMEELKTTNFEEKENLIELQLCAENERKALMEQIDNDKKKLDARWDSMEKVREGLEKDKNAIFLEKEKILKEKIQLEKEEALFEQRKIAAKDDLKYAESRIEAMHQMEAKLQSEMDKLLDLSEFVSRKDAEANEKLAEATNLYEEARKLESVLMTDAEAIEEQKQQLERAQALIVQERVTVLKERSANRDLIACSRDGGLGRSKAFADSSDIVLKQRLATIKSKLDRLRD